MCVFVTCGILLSLLKRSPSCTPASKGRRVRDYCTLCAHPDVLCPIFYPICSWLQNTLRVCGVFLHLLHAVCRCSCYCYCAFLYFFFFFLFWLWPQSFRNVHLKFCYQTTRIIRIIWGKLFYFYV